MERVPQVTVRTPATSANLGPGFDALGLALGHFDEVVVTDAESGLVVEVEGEGAAEVPRDERHLVVRSMRRVFDEVGTSPAGLRLRCTNRIPHGRGMGSSSSAIVAGLLAADALTGSTLGQERLLAIASEIEGHPDNVAPCLLGGFTIAWQEPVGARAVRLAPHRDLVAVVLVPADPVATERARGLLPAVVPHADAAFNAGRSALLVEALTRQPALLLVATEDRLHQDYRSPAMPQSHALVQRLRADGVAATVSGAGPTVLALVPREAAGRVTGRAEAGFTALLLELDAGGASVTTG